MTDDELNGKFAALMALINNNHERDIERFRALDDRLRGIHGQLRTIDQTLASLIENQRLTNTMLGTVVGLLTDFGVRITKLEQ